MTPKTKSTHSLPAKSVLTLIGDVEIYNPKYLIDGIIEESSLVGLIGPSGAGKTFVALDMALSMATGKDYHGLFVKKGLAILSAGEGHLGIPRRVEAWCEYYEKSLKDANFAITSHAIELFNKESFDSFCMSIDSLSIEKGNPVIIVIDTVARHMGGKDENSAKDMGELVRIADELKSKYQCSIVLVHHTGHAQKNRARGSTAYRGALDTEILIKANGIDNIYMTCEKQKDGQMFERVQFVKTKVKSSIVLSQTEFVATKKEKLSKYDQLGLDTFNEVTSETDFTIGPDIKKWRTAFYSTHTGSNKAQNKAFSRCRKNLIEFGYLTLENNIYSLGDIET